jgi:predicted phosphodiesterase
MKICIISDLHCKYQQDTTGYSDTFLLSNKERKPVNQHPVASLLAAINKDVRIKSQILLCPGDLGDRADEQGIISSWTFLEEIKSKLEAQILIGIPGNHDVNSRKKNGKDAFSHIQNFHESFPTSDSDLNNKFWVQGYCIVKHERCLMLLINTVKDHEDDIKADFSTLSNVTIEAIKSEFDTIKNEDFDYKICVLHHHPIKHSNISNYKDSDSLERGDDLLSVLTANNFNIVIHGHKHQPRIVEYNGLPILCSGSFSSFANLQGTGFGCMFHVLELNKNSKQGFIESWEHDLVNGWTQKLNKNFPPKIGFGATLNIEETAKKISDLFVKGSLAPMFYVDVIKEIPEIEYLIPIKLEELRNILDTKYSIKTKPEFPLEPQTINQILK